MVKGNGSSGNKELINQNVKPPSIFAICKQKGGKTLTRFAIHPEVQGLNEMNFWKQVFLRTGLWKHTNTESHAQIAKTVILKEASDFV